ncbi:MAG: hemerythrin domain-containing protein [Luteibaculaceae bacterium]
MINKPTPLKRFAALQPLSREHHIVLQCCFAIRMGIKKNVASNLITDYIQWFYEYFFLQHAEKERLLIESLLSNEHEDLLQHFLLDLEQIKSGFESITLNESEVTLFEKKLVEHIRWQERIFFQEIQKNLSSGTIADKAKVLNLNELTSCPNYSPKFWL